ncbi:putative oxidoreductase [Caenibius tardaugens NBRC 16725]|uniref:Putative oxidoreductase n=1 Tax=Caenibius tardaugens NBRC 16725 TaxID=1219035 RepID=U2Y5E3_9SPHN|nr:FAD-binding oxidoreductase [Caenibius tardaugens]AZI34808.1 FAD-binding oxidoreductase [Caenibius tardaugens NBRC 16725]GAD48331.1 putative oxidoreductase [Caenibius tardaugens NBRC 16725]
MDTKDNNTPDYAAFLVAARQLLGPRGLTQDAELIEPWLTDWRGVYTGAALAMASPGTVEEVAALVRLCAAHGVSLVPQGGNSGMSGGATPDTSGHQIILSLRRMHAIRTIDAEARQVTCEAGVILQNLHEAVAEQGLRFPLTLGGKGSATIGGLISTNAGGTQVLRHGTMRAQVLGLEAILADGSRFDALVPLKKDNRGFDLKQVLIGSEGTLGIITAATLQLAPAPAGRRVLWVGVASLQMARAFLLHCDAMAGMALEGFEIIPAYSLAAVLHHLPGSRAPLDTDHTWHVLVELVAGTETMAGLQDLAEQVLATAFEAGLIENATIAASESQAEAFWLLRESISAAERARGPAVQHDVSVAVEQMPAFIDTVAPRVESAFPGTKVIAYGHLGDGNVHLHVLSPAGSVQGEWQKTTGKKISALIYDCVAEWGGSISAEHGIGQAKLAELARLTDPVRLGMMRAVKHALDPGNILNPGKLVPLAPDQAKP